MSSFRDSGAEKDLSISVPAGEISNDISAEQKRNAEMAKTVSSIDSSVNGIRGSGNIVVNGPINFTQVITLPAPASQMNQLLHNAIRMLRGLFAVVWTVFGWK